MGGVWGNAIAMGLESVPVEARGLLSGILQQGYSLGYLLAAAFTLAFASEGSAPDSFKILFWIGAGASFAVGFIRILFPESEQFIKAKKEGKRGGHTKKFIGKLCLFLMGRQLFPSAPRCSRVRVLVYSRSRSCYAHSMAIDHLRLHRE